MDTYSTKFMKLRIDREQDVRVYTITNFQARLILNLEYKNGNHNIVIVHKEPRKTLEEKPNNKIVVSWIDNDKKFIQVPYEDIEAIKAITIPTGYTIYDADPDNNSKGGRRMRHKRTKRSKRTRCNTRKRIIRRR